MRIHIVGAQGSMGKRYQAILEWLKVPFTTSDIHTTAGEISNEVSKADGIIIATPTNTHFNLINLLVDKRKPILCEKPLTKNMDELLILRALIDRGDLNLSMMAQYRMLDDPGTNGESLYSYFRHGSDSLKWDCIQIIGLARGQVFLDEKSPIWTCKLNGKFISLSNMDKAYVDSVRSWMERPKDDIGRLIDWHQKVIDFDERI